MIGTGTQEDLYIVDNIQDFRTACGISKAYIEITSDIDCNDDPEVSQGWKRINVSCSRINGNGHTIRNIYTAPEGSSTAAFYIVERTAEINNLDFRNIMHNFNNEFFGASNSTYGKLNYCNFSGIINHNHHYCAFAGGRISANNCTFNFKINSESSSGYSFSSLEMYNCEVETEVKAVKYNTSYPLTAYSMINSYVKGSIRFQQPAQRGYITNSAALSYSALKLVNMGTDNIKFSNVKPSVVCFYDSDVLEGTAVAEQDSVYGLTTSQCKDKNYLNSIGFTVV